MSPIITILLLIIILGGINYYLSIRIKQGINYINNTISIKLIFIILNILSIIMILGFIKSLLPFPKIFLNILENIGFLWMGIFIYLILFTIIMDFLLLILFLIKKHLNKTYMRFISLIIIIFSTALIVGYGIYNGNRITDISYNVNINENGNQELNLVLISDIHLGAINSERRLEKIVKRINALKPDIICISGDIFDNDYESIKSPNQAINTLKKLSSTYGVYASLGNHDAGNTFHKMEYFLKKANITLLNDDYVIINNQIILLGRLDKSPIGGYGNIKRKELKSIYPSSKLDLPMIVLEHNPKNIDEYNNDVDLILSGHTHKGQIFPANLFTKLLYTIDYGYLKENNNNPNVIVTSGVGTWGMPFRIGTNNEIVNIKIKL